jgi:hypothetical protein
MSHTPSARLCFPGCSSLPEEDHPGNPGNQKFCEVDEKLCTILFLRSMYLKGSGPAGVIPIDRLTDVRAPAAVIANRIPRAQLEAAYAMHLPRPAPHENPNR